MGSKLLIEMAGYVLIPWTTEDGSWPVLRLMAEIPEAHATLLIALSLASWWLQQQQIQCSERNMIEKA
uniref:Uncharacterized protein n=1 Tax=Caenorhabditis japonica TaxID=281687 RepID=A0A8R1EK65_CAEJA